MAKRASAAGLLLVLPAASALSFVLQPNETRCVSEQLVANSLLTGEWRFAEAPNRTDWKETRMNVYTASGASLFESLEPAGHFSVPATESGSHRICLHNAPNASNTEHAILTIRAALEVEDHSELAKREHVEAVQAELDRMEKMAVHVYEEMVYMRSRSETMQDTDHSTRMRLLWLEIGMMCTLLFMGLWQIHYLKRYFQTKKII